MSANPHVKQNAGFTAFAGVIMLVYGWGYTAVGISDSEFYNATVSLFYWTLKLGGLALVAAAGVCYTGQRIGLLLDGLVSILAGAVFGFCGVYWTTQEGFDLQNMLYMFFGFWFMRAGGANLALFSRGVPAPAAGFPVVDSGGDRLHASPTAGPMPPPQPEPLHPASQPSGVLPKDGEAPPDEGYLAALAKEGDEPPSSDV